MQQDDSWNTRINFMTTRIKQNRLAELQGDFCYLSTIDCQLTSLVLLALQVLPVVAERLPAVPAVVFFAASVAATAAFAPE